MFDFAIIGSGMAGASVAFELARRGKRVAILEREEFVGYHSTGRSAALYSVLYGNPCIQALTAASRAFLERPPEGFASYPLMTPRGCLFTASEAQIDRLEEIEREAARIGTKVERLNAQEVRTAVPILKPGYAAAGLLESGAMDMDVNGLHQGFLRAARANGAQLMLSAGSVRPYLRQGTWVIRYGDEEIQAARIINAAGAWADELAEAVGTTSVGLSPKRRTALLVDPPSVAREDSPAVIDACENFYFKPDAGLLLLSPADETDTLPCDAQPEEIDVAVCIDRVQQVADLPVRRVTRAWAGLRTFVPDRSPVVGYATDIPSFFWLAGQGGYGIQTAPAMARMAADLALGHDIPADIADLGVSAGMVAPGRLQRES